MSRSGLKPHASRGSSELAEAGSLGIVGRTGQLKRSGVSTARTPRKVQVQHLEDWRRRPSQTHAIPATGAAEGCKAFAAAAQSALSFGPPGGPGGRGPAAPPAPPAPPAHVRTEPSGRLSLEHGGVLDIPLDLEGQSGSQSMRPGHEQRQPGNNFSGWDSRDKRDLREARQMALKSNPAGRHRASEGPSEPQKNDLQRPGFFRKTSLPSAVPSQASQVIRKSLDGTLRKFEAENEKSIDLPAQPHASFDLRHQKGLEAGEEASGDHVGFRTRSEDKGLPNEFNKGFSAAPCTLSSSSCSSATADAEMAQQEKEATPVTGNHERFGQQRARTKDAEAAEEQDLLDLLPMPGTSATKGAFGALDPEQQSRAFMKPEGEGCFWTEASVDTFDDEFLCCTELPEEASNGWEQAASRSTRSASSGSPPNHRRPLKAGLDTSAGTSTSQAKPAEFSSHSGPLRKGSGAERTQSPESPDERTEYAEQQHQQNQQNDPQLLRNDLPVAQPLVGPASNHSKLRRGSKTTAGRSKDARDRARESEKERRTSTNSASAVIASEGGKSSRRRSSTRNSKGANSAGVPIHVEEAELSEPESVVTDSDLSEFLQELFRQYSTSRDKKGRPLLSNAGLRRFLQDFTFGPGSKPSAAAQASVAAQADVRYDEEIERQNNMPTVFDLSKGDANRGLCFKSFDIVVNQVNMPCSSKEMTKRWFVTYSYGLASPTPAEVAVAMYEGLH